MQTRFVIIGPGANQEKGIETNGILGEQDDYSTVSVIKESFAWE